MADILQPENSLTVYRNANTTVRLTVQNSDTTPTNLTGARLVFTVKARTSDETVIFQKTSDTGSQISFTKPTGGLAEVYLLPADTKHLPLREYVFDVWMIQGGKQFPVIRPTVFDLKTGVTVL